jgi:hypothetical protein
MLLKISHLIFNLCSVVLRPELLALRPLKRIVFAIVIYQIGKRPSPLTRVEVSKLPRNPKHLILGVDKLFLLSGSRLELLVKHYPML